MPNEILLAVLTVSGIGLIIGAVLAVASVIMAVEKNEKLEAVRAVLPGANCGGCGFSGCDAYAKAIVEENASVSLCPVGGTEVSKKLGEITGAAVGATEKKVAVVRCMGSCDNAPKTKEYCGIETCKAVAQLAGSLTDCSFGCVGLGDCERACPYNALTVCNGVARVISESCRGCGICVKQCPKGLIELVSVKEQATVRCGNHEKGAVARKQCRKACIGCMKCVKVCEAQAVQVKNLLAEVDTVKCTACGRCVEACPVGCITLL